MKKFLPIVLISVVFGTNILAYDAAKAESMNSFYGHFTQKACADSKLFIGADEVMKMLRDKVDFSILDIRTVAEQNVIAVSSSNAIHIPLKSLFTKENLDKLATDKPIIIVCQSGARAGMAAVGLKQLGFKNIQVLKGGISALASEDTPKNAPMHQ